MSHHRSTIVRTGTPSGPRDVDPPHGPGQAGPGTPADESSLSVLPGVRRALVDWMVHHRPVDYVDVALPTVLSRCRADGVDVSTVEAWSIDEVVAALRDDPTPAPTRVTVSLWLPAGTSFAQVASLLGRERRAQPDRTWPEVVLGLACRPRRHAPGRRHQTRPERLPDLEHGAVVDDGP